MRHDSPEEGWANRHGFLHKSLCTHRGPLGTRFAPQAFCKRFQIIPEIKLMRFWDEVQCVTRKWQLSLSQSQMHTVTVKAAISTVSLSKTCYRVLQYCNSFVKTTVCQSKTQLLIFANLQDKSPQRNFTSKSSSIKIKPFSPCRPVSGSQLSANPAGFAKLFTPATSTVPKLLQEGSEIQSMGERADCCFPNCSGSWKATRLHGGHWKGTKGH